MFDFNTAFKTPTYDSSRHAIWQQFELEIREMEIAEALNLWVREETGENFAGILKVSSVINGSIEMIVEKSALTDPEKVQAVLRVINTMLERNTGDITGITLENDNMNSGDCHPAHTTVSMDLYQDKESVFEVFTGHYHTRPSTFEEAWEQFKNIRSVTIAKDPSERLKCLYDCRSL